MCSHVVQFPLSCENVGTSLTHHVGSAHAIQLCYVNCLCGVTIARYTIVPLPHLMSTYVMVLPLWSFPPLRESNILVRRDMSYYSNLSSNYHKSFSNVKLLFLEACISLDWEIYIIMEIMVTTYVGYSIICLINPLGEYCDSCQWLPPKLVRLQVWCVCLILLKKWYLKDKVDE